MSGRGRAPAFPVEITNRSACPIEILDGDSEAMAQPIGPGATISFTGMNERTYIATRAMQGMCTGAPWPDNHDSAEIARRAVHLADCLIEELNKPANIGGGGTG